MFQKIDSQNFTAKAIEKVVGILITGGVIVYPTDTIYGVGCDASDLDAVKKIYSLKGRDDNKPMSFICSDLGQIQQLADLTQTQFEILERNLPGAFTFILNASSSCPKHLQSENQTVGIRIPDHPLCSALVKQLEQPIITTSINQAGQPALSNPQEIETIFGDRIDLILDAGKIENTASTIIDLTQDSPTIIREGKAKLT